MPGDSPSLSLQEASRVSVNDVVDGFVVQCRVLYALVLRETKTRYGEHKLGFVWAFIEPMIMVVVIYLIFSAIGSRSSGNVHFAAFMITGFVPFSMLRDTLTRAESSICSGRQ